MSPTESYALGEPLIAQSLLMPEQMRSKPFAWALLDNFLLPDAASRLSASWPEGGFQMTSRDSGEKRYRMYRRGLVERGMPPSDLDDLDPVWQELVAALRSPEYQDDFARMVGTDLSTHEFEMVLWSYEPSCWLSPHCDKPEKAVTQLIYMNSDWRPAWGGSLQVLSGSEDDDVVQEVSPVLGRSVVLVRSESSWHAVSPVKQGIPHPRRSLQLVFWKSPE